MVRDDIPPATLSLLRWSGALALLLPFALARLRADRVALVRHWKRVVLLGLIGVASFNTLYYLGLHDTTASNGLLLQALIPGLVLLLDRLIFGVRAGVLSIVGVALATLGVAWIVFRGDPSALGGLALGRGDLVILLAMLLWSLYTALLKTKPAVHPLSFLAATFAVAVVALAPVSALELASGARVVWSPTLVAVIAYVAVLPSLVAYLLYNLAVARIGAGAAGQAINLMPPLGALLAAATLGEPLYSYHAVGIALILAGLAVGIAGRIRA